MRVLKWIVGRVQGTAPAVDTPIGYMPTYSSMTWTGLEFTEAQFRSVMNLDPAAWRKEVASSLEFFGKFEDRTPREMMQIADGILGGLARSGTSMAGASPRVDLSI